MAKVESYIICKQQAQKSDVIFVNKTDSDNYSLNDGEKSSSSDDDDHDHDDGITITSAYSTSIKGLQSISPYSIIPSEHCILNTFNV